MTEKPEKQLHVSCGIVRRGGLTLAVQRNAGMSLPFKWEFPGGKIKRNETPGQCLKRELMEELALNVQIGEALNAVPHSYRGFTVILYPFICAIKSGEIVLYEHADFRWLTPSRLPELDWAEADRLVMDAYLKRS